MIQLLKGCLHMPALLSFLNVSRETKNKFASSFFSCAIAVSVIFLFTALTPLFTLFSDYKNSEEFFSSDFSDSLLNLILKGALFAIILCGISFVVAYVTSNLKSENTVPSALGDYLYSEYRKNDTGLSRFKKFSERAMRTVDSSVRAVSSDVLHEKNYYALRKAANKEQRFNNFFYNPYFFALSVVVLTAISFTILAVIIVFSGGTVKEASIALFSILYLCFALLVIYVKVREFVLENNTKKAKELDMYTRDFIVRIDSHKLGEALGLYDESTYIAKFAYNQYQPQREAYEIKELLSADFSHHEKVRTILQGLSELQAMDSLCAHEYTEASDVLYEHLRNYVQLYKEETSAKEVKDVELKKMNDSFRAQEIVDNVKLGF